MHSSHLFSFRMGFWLILSLSFSTRILPAQPSPAFSRPNIVWISTEDLSPRLGAYGDPLANTPNIDRLAREGARYTNAFTTAGVCAPSRSAIITSMYQTAIGTHHMRTSWVGPGLTPYSAVPPPYVKAFTEYLRAAGYYTTNNSKTDYQFAPINDSRQPLTAWDDSSPSAHWRNRPDPNQPFFAVFNSIRTHESKVWPDSTEPAVLDPARVTVPPYYPDTPVVRRDIARHYDNIARMDVWVGEILAQLEADGLMDNTIIFFWGDHGDGLPRAKRWLYDSGLHVPLIVRFPDGRNAGRADDRLLSLLDLGPTVLALAGVDLPVHFQGRPFLGVSAAPEREYIFAARDRHDESYDMVRAARDKRFKYIRNYYPLLPYVLNIPYRDRMPLMQELLRLNAEDKLEGPQKLWFRHPRPPEELYDTQADPHEINNLAHDPAFQEVMKRMRRAMDAWRADVGDLGDIPESEMIERMWPGGVQPMTVAPTIATREGAGDRELLVTIYSPTQGASIAYTLEPGDDPHWLLYTGPLRVNAPATIRARTVRYGWAESAESRAVLTQP